MDQLFLLPARVLAMDSLSFREDVASVAPDFFSSHHLKNSPPHNSLDSTDSNRSSVRVLEDTEGLVFARASNGCLWLCDANNSTLSPMDENNHVIERNDKADLMTMSTPPHLLSAALMGNGSSPEDGMMDPTKPRRIQYNHRNAIALQKEREERVRRVRELQEDERRKKLEELRHHAMQQQKFREQQETERRKRLEEQRARDHDKFVQVEERRKAIEYAEKERRTALLKKNQEREDKIIAKKKSSLKETQFAFGSCTPRMGYPVARTDSVTEVARSSSSMMMSQSMYSQRQSADRESSSSGTTMAQRATSVHGLDKSGASADDGEIDHQQMTQSYHPSTSAHRRRTDLMPTITFNNASPGGTISGSGLSRSSTPGTRMLRSPGKAQSMSRLDILSKPRLKLHASAAHQNTPALSLSSSSAHKRQVPKTASSPPSAASSGRRKMSQSMSHLAHLSPAKKSPTGNGNHRSGGQNKGRSPSAMSGETPSTTTTASTSVKMRLSGHPRRPRPSSIATTGMMSMSASMYEKRNNNNSSNANTPTKSNFSGFEKIKTPEHRTKKPLGKSISTENNDETRSNSSSTASNSKTPRKTPAQVKAESAARKAKSKPIKIVEDKIPNTTTDIDSSNNSESTTPIPIREATPDIIRKSPVKEVAPPLPPPSSSGPEIPGLPGPPKPESDENGGLVVEAENHASKKIIQSEEEAKARLAEKRREMKEKKEREAELERQRQLEAERLEAERKAKEEEEERKAIEEAERLAAEARRAEEQRLQKAIEEAQKREEEERKKKEDEEAKRKEAERKAKEEAERKQAELDEKLKKDEEERLARKRRLDEIMARTRGAGNKSANSTPKKEPQEQPQQDTETTSNGASLPSGDNNYESSSKAQTNGETAEEKHSSLDPTGDPTKPDLLGDIVVSNNSNGTSPISSEVISSNEGLEKGIVDMNISEQTKDEEKLMNVKNESSLLDLDPLSMVTKKQPPTGSAQPEFDQILDLSNDATSTTTASSPPPMMATPLIAFEDNSITTSPKQEVPTTSDLLS